jgi:hypothetical protein
VIEGGGRPTEYEPDDPRERARRIERDAGIALQLVAPAIAIANRPAAELTEMIAAAGLEEAIRAHASLDEAAGAAHALLDTFDAAKARLLAAITAVARDNEPLKGRPHSGPAFTTDNINSRY